MGVGSLEKAGVDFGRDAMDTDAVLGGGKTMVWWDDFFINRLNSYLATST